VRCRRASEKSQRHTTRPCMARSICPCCQAVCMHIASALGPRALKPKRVPTLVKWKICGALLTSHRRASTVHVLLMPKPRLYSGTACVAASHRLVLPMLWLLQQMP
jgi:hypothetical protein